MRTTARLLGFEVSPKVANVFENTTYYPNYKATYDAFIVGVPVNSPNLSVVVDNPRIVSYNQVGHYFVGRDTSTTFATITYQGLVDTIYFNVIDTSSITTGVKDIYSSQKTEKMDMRVYPNPTQGHFTLEIEDNITLNNAKVTIFNIIGQVTTQQNFSGQKILLDLSKQPQGTYFVKLKTESGLEVTRKILKL